MDNQVEEIKQKLDAVTVISRYLPLKKKGRNYWAPCPFHGEKTPSFTVSPELQIFKCFGCGKAGDIFTFLQEYEKIGFREALEELAKQAGIKLVQSENLTKQESQKKLLLQINAEVSRFYHYMLIKHPLGKPALKYVLDRGITPQTIKHFQIGYSPENPQLIINYLTKKSFSQSDLIATGTFGQSQYGAHRLYDRFQNRLVFPLSDHRDRILGFSGRILPGPKADKMAKYVNSPETELYHKSQTLFGLNLSKETIRQKGNCIVVEGEFDLISPYQFGIKNIVAVKGTAFTQEQLQLLKRYTDSLILGLDSDFAGSAAAIKSIESADALGFDIKVIDLKNFKDPDEAVRADTKAFSQSVDNAIPIWDFIINSAVKTYGTDTPRGRKLLLSSVLPSLSKIENSVIKSDYYRKLANQLATSEEAVLQEAVKYQPGAAAPTPINSVKSEPKTSDPVSTKIEKLEEYLLLLILSAKKPISLSQKIKKNLETLTFPKFQKLLNLLSAQKKFRANNFSQILPPELSQVFQDLYLQLDQIKLDSRQHHHEVKKTINQLSEINLKSQLKQLSGKIAQLENQGSPESLRQVENDYNLALQKLSKIQSQKS